MNEIINILKRQIKDNEENMIAFRRELHKHPELSMKEFNTTEIIAKKLEELNIPYKRMNPTGISVEIAGGNPGKTILLRADIDALPIQEENIDIDYASINENIMHACGHDAHVAMLLNAAAALYNIKDNINGTIRIIFQPGEETGEGAKKMIEQGILNKVNGVFGIHINSAWDKGTIYCPEGEMMASNDKVKLNFIGSQCHGARPHQGVDPILMASSFIQNIQSATTREIDALDSIVITFGSFHAGIAANVIAPNAVIEGTVRTFNEGVQDFAEEAIKRYAKNTANMFRGNVEIDYVKTTPPLVNDKDSAKLVYSLVDA